jgi:transcriptional regulator with XRE-family HTH domain
MARNTGNQSTPAGSADDLLAWTRDWGQLLRTARQVAGMSLADLSARTGLSRGYLSKLESGQDGARNPSRATLVALARALPSFRPLAYQLEPVDSAGVSLSRVEEPPRPPRVLLVKPEESREMGGPIQLGWRELEALVALLALERSATPAPLTARLIARAIDRPTDSVISTLERLARSGALAARPPAQPGADPTYMRGPAFEARLGLSRMGDALVIAAALLAHATDSRSIRRGTEAVNEEGGETMDIVRRQPL